MPITISGTSGITYPAGGLANTAGAGVGTTDTQTLTNKTLGSGTTQTVSLIQSGTAQNSTSGTSIDFTSIPSWVKRVTVMFNGVSTSGTANMLLQIGAGGITSTGYTSDASAISGASVGSNTSTAGFLVSYNNSAAAAVSGHAVITLLGSNIWVCSSISRYAGSSTSISGGTVTLGGTLDRVRITSGNGTDTFDAGSINILYE